jgi:hypothetical protein
MKWSARIPVALVLGTLLWPWGPEPRDSRNLTTRLLGPVASLVASVQWVRFDAAVQEGQFESAYAIAERALTLDPRAPQGWMHLASHLSYFRASVENEPNPGRRRQWISAALDLLARGEQQTSEPAELAFMRGLVLYNVSEIDAKQGLGWPGGSSAALTAAIQAFHGAGDLGHSRGHSLAHILTGG